MRSTSIAHHLLLEARVGVNDVPAHGQFLSSGSGSEPMTLPKPARPSSESSPHRMRDATNTSASTTTGRLRGFLTRRPNDLANLRARLDEHRPRARPFSVCSATHRADRDHGTISSASTRNSDSIVPVVEVGSRPRARPRPSSQCRHDFSRLLLSSVSHDPRHRHLRSGIMRFASDRCRLLPADSFKIAASVGRPGGNRTPNLRFWRPLLCQLSYWPKLTAGPRPHDAKTPRAAGGRAIIFEPGPY